MKKIFSLIVLLAGVTVFTSCSDDDATYSPIRPLEISSCDTEYEATGGTGSIVVNTNESITATSEAAWVTVSASGRNVSINVAANDKLTGRSSKITLRSASGLTADVTVTQKGHVFGLGETDLSFRDVASTTYVDVEHSQNVTVKSNADWIKAELVNNGQQLMVSVPDNEGEDPREGTITITVGDVSDEITVTQAGLLLTPAVTFLSKDAKAGFTEKVSVDHSRAVTVETSDEWLTAAFDPADDASLVITAAPNDGERRVGEIVLTSGSKQEVITVVQYDYETDVLGVYYFVYQASGQWTYTPVYLSDNGDGTGSLSFIGSPFDTFGITIPLELDRENMTFSIYNLTELTATYSTDDATYNMMAMVMGTNGSSVYRYNNSKLAMVGEFSVDTDGTFYWDTDANDQLDREKYEFYAFRLGLTSGGYEGYAGALTSFIKPYLMK